ncbi:hypothetical protein BC835DRAFT_1264617 [Cytidiella melzeri]|nr:hypothetical protein BC835DRAFT_1264617 [Cytidiella melzeri]
MGTADNLNLDCLELIVSYLLGNDLFNVSHVSRSFLAAAMPQLYRTLTFHLGNGKRYPKIMTAFDTVNLYPHLAVHVHHIDIRMVPMAQLSTKMYPKFVSSLVQTLQRCINLKTLTCTPNNLLPSLLTCLPRLITLENVRLNPHLTAEQGKYLLSLTKLKTMALDGASWNVVDLLPKWIAETKMSLSCLILSTVQELNEPILRGILQNLPSLQGLHVVACPKIEHVTVLQCLVHTPVLDSLSFTAWESRAVPENVAPLPNLRHLSIDTSVGIPLGEPTLDQMPQIWRYMFDKTKAWSCRLSSIILRVSDRLILPAPLVKDILDAHSSTLKSISLISCEFNTSCLRSVAQRCEHLESLAVRIPTKDVEIFADAFSRNRSLRILQDITEAHVVHGAPFLNTSNVKLIMYMVPNLTRVVSYGRTWTVSHPTTCYRRTLIAATFEYSAKGPNPGL